MTASRREGPAPLSFAQQRLWFLAQLEPESWLYNLSFGLRLRGPLDVDALRASFEVVATQHDQLRTWFLRVEGRPAQVDLDSPAVPFDRQTADPGPGLSLEQYVEALAGEEARRPFALEGGLLWRVKLVQLGDQDHLLLVTLHHAIADGWSLNLLLADMLAAYGALRDGEPVAVPTPTVRYADYARWQREWLTGEVLDRELDYWKRTLAGAPPVEPARRPSSSHYPDVPWGTPHFHRVTGRRRRPARAESETGRNPVHDVARGVSGVVAPV